MRPAHAVARHEEVAQVVLMLTGNAYMTGQTGALSGGMSFN